MSPALGAALGATTAAGVLLVVWRLPVMRRPRLTARLDPYLRETASSSRLLLDATARTPFPTLERLIAPVLLDLARRLDGWLGGTASVRRRLDRLGDESTVEQLRLSQVVWAALGALVGVLVALGITASKGAVQPVPMLALVVLATAGGVVARDRQLSTQVRRREERMLAELPTVAEMLALAVSAGESASGAIQRVAARSDGELARELRRALAETAAGVPLVRALEAMADRTALPALSRFVDGIVVAVERGTPLADVLRAQAVDVREDGRRALLETGARRELAMMVPVVFLVLPVSVVFALFPGFFGLSLSAP